MPWLRRSPVVIGEVSDAEAIDRAVQDTDAIALGPSMDRKATDTPLIEGTRLILEAMKRHGVRCFVGSWTRWRNRPWSPA
ncbi:NAD(P)H-binding protein [Nocardia grenadensis]